jgi:MFS family permease
LFLARAVYAFNWYNVGAVLSLIGTGLDATTIELGIVLGAFLLGAAVFQLPAGLASLRWGSRRVCLTALVVMGAFSLASAFSPNWYVLAALRFGAGAGAAMFFAPALGLVAAYYPAGSRGPIIGLYNAGFSVGSAIGLIAGAVVGVALGWPWALAIGGIGLLIGAAAASWVLPHVSLPVAGRTLGELLRAARPVLRSTSLWALALALTGAWGAFYIVAQYFVAFASDVHPGWSLVLAAALPTVMIVVEIVGGPVGGLISERRRDMRYALLAFGVPSSLALLLIPFLPIAGLLAVFVFLGFADGVVFADLYLIPTYHSETAGEGLSLALALINCVQIFGGSVLAIAFGVIATVWGWTAAWVFAGLVGVGTLPLLLWVRGTREAGALRTADRTD